MPSPSPPRTDASPREPLRNWPLLDEQPVSSVILATEVLVGLLVGHFSQSLWAGFFSFGALCLATWRIWLPVGYEIRPEGLVEQVLGRRVLHRWHEYSAVRRLPDGVLLVPAGLRAGGRTTAPGYIHGGERTEWLYQQIAGYLGQRSGKTDAAGGSRLGNSSAAAARSAPPPPSSQTPPAAEDR